MFYRQFGLTKMEGYYVPKEVFYKIPKLMQCSPDFWVVKNEFHFVECKMADKKSGTHVKIKEHDMAHYQQWGIVASLLFYIHNPMYSESYILKLEDLENIIAIKIKVFYLIQITRYRKRVGKYIVYVN